MVAKNAKPQGNQNLGGLGGKKSKSGNLLVNPQ